MSSITRYFDESGRELILGFDLQNAEDAPFAINQDEEPDHPVFQPLADNQTISNVGGSLVIVKQEDHLRADELLNIANLEKEKAIREGFRVKGLFTVEGATVADHIAPIEITPNIKVDICLKLTLAAANGGTMEPFTIDVGHRTLLHVESLTALLKIVSEGEEFYKRVYLVREQCYNLIETSDAPTKNILNEVKTNWAQTKVVCDLTSV